MAAVVPLVLILFYIGVKGFSVFSADFFTKSMNGVTSRQEGGGLYHALIGTLELVAIASVIALPIGIFTAIYLVEYGRGKFARAVTFFVDVMTGVPSIVAGLFVYTFLLLGFGMRPFGIAGAIALAILMIPVAVRSSEEMLKLVPRDLREASYALGVPKWRTILKVVLPTAMSGLITSSLLAIARITGETAPLILLVGYTARINYDPFSGDMATLPMMVWDQLGKRAGTTSNDLTEATRLGCGADPGAAGADPQRRRPVAGQTVPAQGPMTAVPDPRRFAVRTESADLTWPSASTSRTSTSTTAISWRSRARRSTSRRCPSPRSSGRPAAGSRPSCGS